MTAEHLPVDPLADLDSVAHHGGGEAVREGDVILLTALLQDLTPRRHNLPWAAILPRCQDQLQQYKTFIIEHSVYSQIQETFKWTYFKELKQGSMLI